MILLIRQKATENEIVQMLENLRLFIKLAVDVQEGILAGGGSMHADCESVLLQAGCLQDNIWGADWNPFTQAVSYESLINIRPRLGNRSMEVQDPNLRTKIEQVTVFLLGGIYVEKRRRNS